MRTIRVKYDKTLDDGSHSYYMVNVDDLREQVKLHLPGINYRDFYYCSTGFVITCDRKIEHIIGVRKGWAEKLVPLEVVPILS